MSGRPPRAAQADVKVSPEPQVSLARLLDDARERLVQAWDREEEPQYLLVHPSLYEVVARQKAREVQRGRPLRLLGLLLVSSTETEVDAPEVR